MSQRWPVAAACRWYEQEKHPVVIRRTAGDGPRWTAAGGGGREIAPTHGPVDRSDGRRLMVVFFGILGAVLIGGGIILLLAHNWEQLTRPMRAVISFLPLLTGLGLAGWVLMGKSDSTAWCEGVGAFWVLSIGTAIALVAQTYNLGGDFGDFMLGWVLLGLPIIYLLGSSVAAALYWAGVTAWGLHARWTSGIELWFWPLLALAVPHLWRLARGDRYHPRVSWLVWVLAIGVSIGTGASLTDRLADYWILVYASLFTVMWLAGRQWFDEGTGVRRMPLQSVGAIGMMGLALMLTYPWPWRELTWRTQWWEHDTPWFWPRLAVVALWPVSAMCLWGAALRRKDIAGAVAGLMPVLAVLGFVLGDSAERRFAMPLVFDAFLLAVGVALIVAGVRERRLGVTNGGMLVFSALIICRFFDSDLELAAKGLAFIAVGAGFLVTNLWLVKRTKAAQ
jgi:uncharacterized membrane protein